MGIQWSVITLVTLISATVVAPAQWETLQVEEHKGAGVKFTRPDGTPVYVNPRAVAFVRAPLDAELGNATIVFSSGAKQAVVETVDQVIEAIHADMPEQP